LNLKTQAMAKKLSGCIKNGTTKVLKYVSDECVEYPIGIDMTNAMMYITNVEPLVRCAFVDFDPKAIIYLWVMGSSGAILGALFATKFTDRKVVIIHKKKEGESAHCSNTLTTISLNDLAINIILDDFSCTGNTVNTIYNYMADNNKSVDITILDSFDADKLKFHSKFLITRNND